MNLDQVLRFDYNLKRAITTMQIPALPIRHRREADKERRVPMVSQSQVQRRVLPDHQSLILWQEPVRAHCLRPFADHAPHDLPLNIDSRVVHDYRIINLSNRDMTTVPDRRIRTDVRALAYPAVLVNYRRVPSIESSLLTTWS